MFDKIMFAVVILMALGVTIAVVYGLVVGFWAIVVLFYKCYLE